MRVYIISVIVWGCVLAGARPAREDALPKTVWTYATSPHTRSLLQQLCIQKMLDSLARDRWVLEIITAENYFNYLEDYERFLRVRNQGSPGLSFPDLLPLIRLHVLQRYGGFWMDPSTVLLAPLHWVPALHQLPQVSTFGLTHYEMVLFSRATDGDASTGWQRQEDGAAGGEGRFRETALVLALKNSSVVNRWLQELERRVERRELMSEAVRLYSEERFMEVVSLQALQSVLSAPQGATPEGEAGNSSAYKIQHALLQYKIWEFVYLDYEHLFQMRTGSTRLETVADIYLKYELSEIQLNFGQAKYFVSLGRTSEIIDAVINPNVSKLHFLNKLPALDFLNPRQDLDCVHYVLRHSFIDEHLIQPSRSQAAGQVRRRSRGMRERCREAYSHYFWREVGVKVGASCLGVVGVVVVWAERVILGVVGRQALGAMGREVVRWVGKWAQMRERMRSIALLPV